MKKIEITKEELYFRDFRAFAHPSGLFICLFSLEGIHEGFAGRELKVRGLKNQPCKNHRVEYCKPLHL